MEDKPTVPAGEASDLMSPHDLMSRTPLLEHAMSSWKLDIWGPSTAMGATGRGLTQYPVGLTLWWSCWCQMVVLTRYSGIVLRQGLTGHGT